MLGLFSLVLCACGGSGNNDDVNDTDSSSDAGYDTVSDTGSGTDDDPG